MTKQKKGDVTTILMIIGGIFILLSVLVVGVSVYQSARWGPCWANFNQEMGEIEKALEQKLKTQESTEVTITMGDCVSKLIFLDKKSLDDLEDKIGKTFTEELKCPARKNQEGEILEGSGFIIGIPYFEETKSGLKFWQWPKDYIENIVRSWQEKVRGIGPLCKGLDRGINLEDIDGPGEGKTRTICLELSKIGDDKYGIDYREGVCA